jgi:hypothetical protein
MALILNGTTGVSNVQSGVIQPEDLTGNQTGDAPIYGCRAWVNFDGTRNVTDTGASTNGQPVKIRASGNVTSVTKNAVGNYTVNFATAMQDVDYCATATVSDNGLARVYVAQLSTLTVGNIGLLTKSHTSTSGAYLEDFSQVHLSIFR